MKHDLAGKTFDRWTVIERAPNRDGVAEPYWVCRCACGTIKSVNGQRLRMGDSRSCGCYRRENPSRRTHGKTGTREYKIWSGLSDRCFNSRNPAYKDYGGRGISVCPAWNSFETFLSDMGPCPPLHTLERNDNSIGYEPGNCRWATRRDQARNTRRNHLITWNGITRSLVEWSEEIGISQKTLANRLRSGWGVEMSLTTPIRSMKI